ncbi:hypothetical protein NCC49_003287 [Naganishia albida]|nr:hypothetical protein NCC49_003287 [Naganishia albida]
MFAPSPPPGFVYDANMQLVPYNPPPTNPWAPQPNSESTSGKRKSSGSGTGKQKGGRTKKKRGSNDNVDAGDVGNDEDEGGASSERGYARWDRQNDDGLTSEGCLVQWMSGGGWRKWRNAKSTGEKEKCYREINAHLQEYGHIERTPDSILAKFKTLENSYKKALIWKHSTGSGSYSTTAGDDEDGRSPYQQEIDARCKHYDALQLAFGERAFNVSSRTSAVSSNMYPGSSIVAPVMSSYRLLSLSLDARNVSSVRIMPSNPPLSAQNLSIVALSIKMLCRIAQQCIQICARASSSWWLICIAMDFRLQNRAFRMPNVCSIAMRGLDRK